MSQRLPARRFWWGVADGTKEKKRRAYRAKWAREHRAKIGKTEGEVARAAGKIAELRARKAKEVRERRRREWEKNGRPRRGPQPPVVVEIKPIASPEVARGYPHFAELVRDWAPRLIARYRQKYTARALMYVCQGAASSLPERPTELEWKAWLSALHEGKGGRPIAPGTLNRWRGQVFSLYEFARTRGGPWHNPIADVEPLKDDRMRIVPLNERNIETYFARAMALLEDPRDRALVAVLRFTGMRISEVLALRAEDIGEEDGRQSLHVSRQRKESTYRAEQLKHIRQRRFLFPNPRLFEHLRAVLRLGPAKVAMGNFHRPTSVYECPYLFPHRTKAMRKLAKKLKAMLPDGDWPPGQAFHAFRHAFAIEAYRKGRLTKDEISQLLGHSSTEVTDEYLRDLLGADAPVSGLERLWAAQNGEPVAVESRGGTFDDGKGSLRRATKSQPLSVVRLDSGPVENERRGKKWD